MTQKIKLKSRRSKLPLPCEISKQEVMTFSEIKQIVGITNVKIKSSSFRYSELYALVDCAATMKSGVLSIVVEEDTLNSAEISTLAGIGGLFVSFDLAER